MSKGPVDVSEGIELLHQIAADADAAIEELADQDVPEVLRRLSVTANAAAQLLWVKACEAKTLHRRVVELRAALADAQGRPRPVRVTVRDDDGPRRSVQTSLDRRQ